MQKRLFLSNSKHHFKFGDFKFVNNKHTNIELRIIALLRQRDKEAIELLYDNYSAALYGIILKIIPSQAIAQEVLQDVFVKVWNNSDKYDADKGRLFTWLAQITRNAAKDTLRSRDYKQSNKTDTLDDNVNNDSSLAQYPQTTDSGLRKVIDGLDDKYKEIIDLLYFKEYSHSEAAKELDIPIGTLKSRVRKAILQLRKILGNEQIIILLIIQKIINL